MTFQQAYNKMRSLADARYFSVAYSVDDHEGNPGGGGVYVTCELYDGDTKKLYSGETWAQAFGLYEADKLDQDRDVDVDLSEAPGTEIQPDDLTTEEGAEL